MHGSGSSDEELRPERAAHDVRLQDGAHEREGPLLRVRPRLLRQSGFRHEGVHTCLALGPRAHFYPFHILYSENGLFNFRMHLLYIR